MSTLDSVHADEAVKVFAKREGDHDWTLDEEKEFMKKIDRKLMPILFLTYGLQYFDKAMISQAVSDQFFPSCSRRFADIPTRHSSTFTRNFD